MRRVIAALMLLFVSCSAAAAQSVTGEWTGTWSWTACPSQWPCDGVQHDATLNLLRSGTDVTGSAHFEVSYAVTGTLSGSTLTLTLTPTPPIGDLHSTCVLQVTASHMGGPCTQFWNELSGSWRMDAYLNPLTSSSLGTVTWYGAGATDSYALAVGDVDNDGFADVVISNMRYEPANGHTGVTLYINNGDGTFHLGARFATDGFGASSQSVAVDDVNGDSHADLVVLNSGNSRDATQFIGPSVSVILGNGDGTFQAAVSYFLSIDANTSVSPNKVAVADVNGDGRPEVIVSSGVASAFFAFVDDFRGGVSVLLNHGDGTFADPVLYDSGGYVGARAIAADVNGDGNPDIVAINHCSTVVPPAVVSGHVDGDPCRAPDGAYSEGTVSVLLGNGNGTFQQAAAYPSGGIAPGALAAADVNRDGEPDLLVEHAACFQCLGTTTAVLIGNGDGTFAAPVTYDNGAITPVSVAAGDIDGDGAVDAVVYDYANLLGGGSCDGCTGMLSVLPGNGNGTFQEAVLYSLWDGVHPNSVVVSDLDNDGRPDVVVLAWAAFGVLLNQTPRSATATTLASQPAPSGIGQAVTFTATVSSAAPGVPAGTVTFREGATVLGTAPLVNAEATLSYSGLALGSHAIVASYSSDSAFRASDSGPLTHLVVDALASVTVSPASVVGGRKATGTVTLSDPAPASGAVVTLSSGDASASVKASVKVAAGATSARFTVSTTPVTATTGPFNVSATYQGVTLAAPLTVLAATPSTLTIRPASVVGGLSAEGTVKLTGPAPAGGAVVALASAHPSATVPGSVTVPARSTSATFTVTTVPVATTQGPFDVSATSNGITRSDRLIVKAPAVLSVALDPTTVPGGGPSTGTVALTGAAPPGGMTVILKSSKTGVATVPPSVIVPAGSSAATFNISTLPITVATTATISATTGGPPKKAALRVTP